MLELFFFLIRILTLLIYLSFVLLKLAFFSAIINQSKVYNRSNSTADIIALPIMTTVSLAKNDYVEVYVLRYSSTGDVF